jgi:hypothetical protein
MGRRKLDTSIAWGREPRLAPDHPARGTGAATRPARPAATGRASPVLVFAALGACVLLALLLRLHRLGEASLWADEIATLAMLRLPLRDIFGPIAALEPNPPAYYALMKLFAGVTGESDAGLRLPSAIAGAAALVPLFLFARGFGLAAAFATALLAALAGQHVLYSQEARSYALLFLAVCAALLVADRLTEAVARPGGRKWALAALLGVLGGAMVNLHTTAVFAIAALYAYAATVLAVRRQLSPTAVLAFAAAGLLALGLSAWWLRLAVGIAADSENAVSWIRRPGLADCFTVFSRVLAAPLLQRLEPVAVGLNGALLVSAAVMAWRRRDARALGLLAGLAAGAGLLVAASQMTPVLLVRTALFTLVFALPLYGWALARIRPRWLGLAVAVVALALQVRSVSNHYMVDALGGRNGEDWASALRGIEAAMAPGERVVVIGSFEAVVARHYGGERVRSAGPSLVVQGANPQLGLEVARRLPGAEILDADALGSLDGAAGFWVVSHASNTRPQAERLIGRLRERGWPARDSSAHNNIRVDHLSR